MNWEENILSCKELMEKKIKGECKEKFERLMTKIYFDIE